MTLVSEDIAATRRAVLDLERRAASLVRHYGDTVDASRLLADVSRLGADLELLCGAAAMSGSDAVTATVAAAGRTSRTQLHRRVLDGRRGRGSRPDPLTCVLSSPHTRDGGTAPDDDHLTWSRRDRGRAAGAGRAAVAARTLRTDRWWLQPLLTVVALVAFIVYSTLRAFENANYYASPYISPFYSPCITTHCEGSRFPSCSPVRPSSARRCTSSSSRSASG